MERANVHLELLNGHADAGISDDQPSHSSFLRRVCFGRDGDVELARRDDRLVPQGCQPELLERVVGVREEFSEEDFLVAVEVVDDDAAEAGDVRLLRKGKKAIQSGERGLSK